MNTLSDGTTTIDLDPDLHWEDEFDWAEVEQSVEYSVTGALIIQVAKKEAGFPVTLVPDEDDSAWMSRQSLAQIQAWSRVPGQKLTLVLGKYGKTLEVVFRHQDGAIEARPVEFFPDPQPDDWLLVTLRFMTV